MMRHQFIIFCIITLTVSISCRGDRLVAKYNTPKETYPETGFLWGFMNHHGDVVIPSNFQEVRDFNDSLAAYRHNYLWGYINQAGTEIIKPKYMQAHSFSNQLARVVTTDGRTLYIDPFGKSAFDLHCSKAGNFSNNRAPIWKNNKVGYINSLGKVVINPKYDDGNEFYLGTAIVKIKDKFGLIDPYGKFLLKPEYDLIYIEKDSKDNLYLLKKNGLVGYYNLSSEEFLPITYDDGQPFFHHSAVVKKDSLYGVINKKGHWLLQPIFSELINLGNQRWALFDEKEYFMIDKDGLQYGEGFNQIYRFSENLSTVKIDQKWGYVDTLGEFIIQPIYDVVWPFKGGRARVGTSSGVGFIDKEGNYIIEPQLVDVRDFQEGLARFSVHK